MVVNEASHIFIFCMDRIIYGLDIYNVDIEYDKNNVCMFYLADLVPHLE